MADSDLWRHTDLGVRVFNIFNDEELARLATYVEKRGFRNSEAQAELPELIRGWAFRWLNEIDGPKRRQRPDGKGRRDADRDEITSRAHWEKVVKNITKVRQSLESLPPGTKSFLIKHLARRPNKSLKQVVATWPDGRNPLAQLIHELGRLQVATPPLIKRGNKPKPHSAAVHELAKIWILFDGEPTPSDVQHSLTSMKESSTISPMTL